MALLAFSVMKRNAINFFRNSILYIHLWFYSQTGHCCFLLCWLKSLTKILLLQFIKNPHSRDSIRAGIHLDQRKRKLILLALLFIELFKFALLKSFQVKSTKSKYFATEWIHPEVIISKIKKDF